MPVSDVLSTQMIALPMLHDLTDEHFGVVEAALKKVAGAYAKGKFGSETRR